MFPHLIPRTPANPFVGVGPVLPRSRAKRLWVQPVGEKLTPQIQGERRAGRGTRGVERFLLGAGDCPRIASVNQYDKCDVTMLSELFGP